MGSIRNVEALVANATTPNDRLARQLALGALNEAVAAADPIRVIAENVKIKGSHLVVKDDAFDLRSVSRILVVGAGKATAQMAYALEGILEDRVSEGYVNVLRGSRGHVQTKKIVMNEASHPLPDEAGLAGTRRMVDLIENTGKGDLVICLLSGGASALMPLPRGEVSLEEKQNLTNLLLKSGANIQELNAVRKHLSEIKGGWLAKKVRGGQVISLIISDVVGDSVSVIASGPTAPDDTTFSDAVSVLRRYGLWDGAPENIRKVLADGARGKIPRTPKADDEAFKAVRNYVLFNNRLACEAAVSYLNKSGISSAILSTTMEGEAREVGTVLGGVGREMAIWDAPLPKPAACLAGGETTVTVRGNGVGGRNQEVALGAAMRISNLDGVVVASLATDGIDGPTDAAGAIVDGRTISRAEERGMQPKIVLSENDSYRFFSAMGDLILTGLTGTNVNDIVIIVAVGKQHASTHGPFST